jgi:hypothetical protein
MKSPLVMSLWRSSKAPAEKAGAMTWYERLLIGAALIGGAVFIGVGIKRPLFVDEAYSVLIAGRGIAGILNSLSRDNSMPFYYVLLSLWIRLFGDSEIALRSLSACFYVAGCGAAFALGKRLSGSARAGFYSALLYECSPLAIHHAQNIRMYEMLGTLSGLSTLVFLRMFRDGKRGWRWWNLFIALNAAGLLTHIWFFFLMGGQFLAALLLERRQWRFFVAGAASFAAFLALWGWPFIGQLHNRALSWLPQLPMVYVTVSALADFAGNALSWIVYIAAVAGFLWLVAGRRTYVLRQRDFPPYVTILVAGIAMPLLVTAVKPIYWPGRAVIIALAVWAAVLGTFLDCALPKPFLIGLCSVLLVWQTANQVAMREWDVLVLRPQPPERSDRVTAMFLLSHASPGDAVVFTSLSRPVADYYFRRAGAQNRFVEISFPAELDSHPGWSEDSVPPHKRPLFVAEAAATARRLVQLTADGRQVWFYDGRAEDVGSILKRQLDTDLALRCQYPLAGLAHQQLLNYAARRRASSAGIGLFNPI